MFGHLTYLVFELVWALPVILAQAFLGLKQGILQRAPRLLVLGTLVPTAYFSAADAVAIHAGIWTINPARTAGPRLGALPLEEAIFFLLTNLMVVQGVLLFSSAEAGSLRRSLALRLRARRGDGATPGETHRL